MTEEEKAMLALLDEPVVANRPSRHTLARIETGEVAGDGEAHPLVRELEADREAFLLLHPAGRFADALETRRTRRRWWRAQVALPVVLVAAAAAVVALSWVPADERGMRAVQQETRLKAAPDLSFHVERDGVVEAGQAGGVYHPGDRIQLRYSTGSHRHLVVVSLDSAGAVTPFYDAAGRSLDIEPGVQRLLDGSITLDAALGVERIVGCFSDEALPTDEIVKAARDALAEAGGDPAKLSRLQVPCAQATFLIDKRER